MAVKNFPEIIQGMLAGDVPLPPITRLIGFDLTAAGHGQASFTFQAEARHANALGTLHGGVLCDVTDMAMGLAYATTLAEGESFTTIELKINFLRPIWTGLLSANARVIKGGRTLGLVECDVLDDQQRLVARASSTCLTLRGEAARGR
jgi:uncharacterized protein (TIGR00369 family)